MKCESGFDCYSMTGLALEDCPNFFKCGNFRGDATQGQLCDQGLVWEDICCNDICPECGNKGILTHLATKKIIQPSIKIRDTNQKTPIHGWIIFSSRSPVPIGEFVCDLDLTLPSTLDDIRFDNYCPTCFWLGSILDSHIGFLIWNRDRDPRAEGTLVRFYARPTLCNVEASSQL